MIRLVLIVLAAVVLAVLVQEYHRSKSRQAAERFNVVQSTNDRNGWGGSASEVSATPLAVSAAGSKKDPSSRSAAATTSVLPTKYDKFEAFEAVDPAGTGGATQPKDPFPKDGTLTPSDLLPSRDAANSLWAQVNPAGQGSVRDQNFLNAGYHIGVNTVGQSLRNPNMDLRSEPPNPKVNVSIWNQSTIEPDVSRRPLEIGITPGADGKCQ